MELLLQIKGFEVKVLVHVGRRSVHDIFEFLTELDLWHSLIECSRSLPKLPPSNLGQVQVHVMTGRFNRDLSHW